MLFAFRRRTAMISLKKICYFQITLFVIGTLGHPVSDPKQSPDDNCIQMTTDNVEKINHLVEEISSFINKISTKYDDIDLRLVNIAVDKHSLVEDKKNTIVNVTISDCLDGITHTEYREKPDDSIYDIDDDINENKPDTDISTSTPKGFDEDDSTNVSDEYNDDDDNDSYNTEINDEKINNEDPSSVEDSKGFSDDGDVFNDNFDTFNDSEDFNDKDDTNDEIDETEELPDDNNSKQIEPIVANDDDIITNDDEIINKTQNYDSHKGNDTVAVHFINFNDIKDTDNKKNTCQEILLLSEEDKVVFKEIEKLRGTKSFFLYQRFFNDTSQFWFL